MLAGSPGSAQSKTVITNGTRIGSVNAASIRTSGLTHHRSTPASQTERREGPPAAHRTLRYRPYFQESISVK